MATTSKRSATSRSSRATLRSIVIATAVLLAPAMAFGQRCRTEEATQDRAAWEESRRETTVFQANLDSVLRSGGIEPDEGLIQARPATAGGIELEIVDLELPANVRAEVQALFEHHLADDPSREALWSSGAPEIPFRDRRELCKPVLENKTLIVEELRWIQEELRKQGRRPIRHLQVPVDLLVDHRGVVRIARLTEPTGNEWLDRELRKLGLRLRWEPGQINDTPTGVWTRVPFVIR
jgi:hypothetical protein